MKILKTISDIWKTEAHYDELRWLSQNLLSEKDDKYLSEMRLEVIILLEELTVWMNRRRMVISLKRNRLRIFKQKLIEFEKIITHELQRREKARTVDLRLTNLHTPKEIDATHSHASYGLSGELKGSDFYKTISEVFAPRPKLV